MALRAAPARCEKAETGPRRLPRQDAGAPPPSPALYLMPLPRGKIDRRVFLHGGLGADGGRQRLIVDADRRQRALGRRAVDRRDRGDGVAGEGHRPARIEQRYGGLDAGKRLRGFEVERDDAGAGVRGAQDRAFQLAVVADVERVDRRAGRLVARLDARRFGARLLVQAGAGVGDGAVDVVISAAAAEMAGKGRADLLARGRGPAVRRPPSVVERLGLDDEAGRAEAALQRVQRHEGALHGMQFSAADPLDGRDRPARRRLRRHEAACDRLAVHEHGASAADAGAADELGPGQAEPVAQGVGEHEIVVVGEVRPAVH